MERLRHRDTPTDTPTLDADTPNTLLVLWKSDPYLWKHWDLYICDKLDQNMWVFNIPATNGSFVYLKLPAQTRVSLDPTTQSISVKYSCLHMCVHCWMRGRLLLSLMQLTIRILAKRTEKKLLFGLKTFKA